MGRKKKKTSAMRHDVDLVGRKETEDEEERRFSTTLEVHPSGHFAIVGLDTTAFLLDLVNVKVCKVVQAVSSNEKSAGLRVTKFDPTGSFVVTAGDDKHVRLWDASLECHHWQLRMTKKISAAAFSLDGKYLFFADRFGDVYHLDVDPDQETPEPRAFLGHFGSAIHCIVLSPCGNFLVTCDSEGKIRVNRYPPDPQNGCHEIESFCLGHEGLVSTAVFVYSKEHVFVLSGGNDGTLRLWNVDGGLLLDVLDFSKVEGSNEKVVASNEKPNHQDQWQEDYARTRVDHDSASYCGWEPAVSPCAVTFLVSDETRSNFAVAQASSAVVYIIKVDCQQCKILVKQKLSCPDSVVPVNAAFLETGKLLVVGRTLQGIHALVLEATMDHASSLFVFNPSRKLQLVNRSHAGSDN